MFGIGKKKKTKDKVSESSCEKKSVTKSKKKRGSGISFIFQESVVETAIEEFKANESFVVEKDGQTKFVGMLLKADDIGGLGKKSRKDEAKGQFIEEVVSGLIKTYIPSDLMDLDEIIIIPDVATLVAMDEFSMLVEAPYHVVYVNLDGSVEKTDYLLSYDKVVSVMNEDIDIYDMLFDCGDNSFGDALSDDDFVEEDDAYDDFADNSSDDTEFVDDFSDQYDDLDLDYDNSDLSDEYSTDGDFGSDDISGNSTSDATGDFDMNKQGEDFDHQNGASNDADQDQLDDEVVVTQDDISQAITRRFYSDDLGLEVSTEAFDAQFLHANPYISFDENRGDSWLNKYMNQMAKDANIEMKRLHQQNLFNAREMFYRLISKHSEEIQHKLDTEDPSTQYGQILNLLKQERNDNCSSIDRKVSQRRLAIDKDWNEKLEQVGEDAKRSAIRQYCDRFGKEHDATIFRIEPDLRNEIESEYNEALREMQKKRREEAATLMDYGITETLAEVSKVYMDALKSEQETYKMWRERMNEFLDNHRKDEIAHDQILAKELEQSNKADNVIAEYTEKLKNQTEEFEARKLVMKSELESMERQTSQIVRDKQAECDNRIAKMQSELDEQKAEMSRLLDKYTALDMDKERQYSARLAEAKDEQIAWADKCKHIISMNKRANVVSIMLAVVACIAFLAIGTILGSNLNLEFGSKRASDQIVQEYTNRLDKLEQEKTSLEKKLEERFNDRLNDEAEKINPSEVPSGN